MLTGVALALIGLLHVLSPTRSLDPLTRTISEYALMSDGWVFDLGVVLLAAGSALILVAMIRRGLVTGRPWAVTMTAVWCIGLVGLVIFPKQGFGPDSTFLGRIHWTWTLVAFFSLPIGLFVLAKGRAHGQLALARGLAWVSAGWFVVLALQTAVSAAGGAWNLVGLVERTLSTTEILAVGVLGWWTLAPRHDLAEMAARIRASSRKLIEEAESGLQFGLPLAEELGESEI